MIVHVDAICFQLFCNSFYDIGTSSINEVERKKKLCFKVEVEDTPCSFGVSLSVTGPGVDVVRRYF